MGETKFQTHGDRLVASELLINEVDQDLIFFSLNHGILKGKETSIRMGYLNGFLNLRKKKTN